MKPPLPYSTRTVIDCFADNPVWGTLLPTLERLGKVQIDLNSCLPAGLKSKASVASFSDDNLCVAVASAAVATKLRQTLPRIEAGLHSRGWKVNAIQIRVQPGAMPYDSKTYKKNAKNAVVTSHARDTLTELAGHLEEGALRDAVARLAGR
jgi:hypothetical protein